LIDFGFNAISTRWVGHEVSFSHPVDFDPDRLRRYHCSMEFQQPAAGWHDNYRNQCSVDWNRDGKVDFAEFATTARSVFEEMDRNHNGVLEGGEVRVPPMRGGPRRGGFRL